MRHFPKKTTTHIQNALKLYVSGLALLLISVFPGKAIAAATSYQYVTPACGPIYNGTTLSFDIHEDSGTTAVNAVQSDLSYSTSQFSIVSVTGGSSINSPFTLIAQNDTSVAGKIKFGAASLSNVTGDQLVARVVLQATTSSGAGTVTFDNTSAVADPSGPTSIPSTTTGGTYPQTISHTCGSLVKAANNPTVYLIADGTRETIPSVGTFNSQGLNWNLISIMTTADQALPIGSSIQFRAGSLVKGSGSTVYIIDNTAGVVTKRPINSINVFTALGYTSSDILTVTDSELPADGSPLTSTTVHPAGTLVKASNGTIYLTGTSSKQYVGSVYVMYTYGYNFGQVKSGTTADLALADGGALALRYGTLIKGVSTPGIYVSDVVSGIATKHNISSMTTFNALGYSTGQLLTIPDSNLPAVNDTTL